MEEHWYNLIAAVLTTIAVIGSSANLAVIIIVARNRKVHCFDFEVRGKCYNFVVVHLREKTFHH